MHVAGVILAALLLGAHFLREGHLLLTLACLLAPLLLLVRRRWALVALQLGCHAAGVIWLLTAFRLVRLRMALGEPWGRMLLILGLVSAVSIGAGLLLNRRTVRERYQTGS